VITLRKEQEVISQETAFGNRPTIRADWDNMPIRQCNKWLFAYLEELLVCR